MYQLDGLLQIIYALDNKILKVKNIGSNLESIFESIILPMFDHPKGYIRLRACQIYGDFGEFTFQKESTV